MSGIEVAVTVGIVVAGLLLVGLLVAKHSMRSREWAVLTADGYQEAHITINGRYRPDMLRVEQGVPVRIRFLRGEDNPCSERVVFSAFGVDRRLAAFQETSVEFVPTAAGTFLFTCQWGMYRGKLVVTPSRDKPKASRTVKSGRNHGRSD